MSLYATNFFMCSTFNSFSIENDQIALVLKNKIII